MADAASPEERLGRLVLEVRHRAALHLGVNVGRANRWLEEYYFLLGCYGVCTGRYPNPQDKERVAAFVSAGTALARLSWPRTFSRPAPPSLSGLLREEAAGGEGVVIGAHRDGAPG